MRREGWPCAPDSTQRFSGRTQHMAIDERFGGAMPEEKRFSVLRSPCRVWAVASVHGECERLERIHAALAERIADGDKLVYLGNLLGRGPAISATIDAALGFRRAFLARQGNDVPDIAFLRGAQEEMWNKLFELQFAVNAVEVLEWMLDHGVGATIEDYGASPGEGLAAARQGTMALGRWTTALRDAVRGMPGHRELLSALRRAAYTDDGRLLFVNAGIDPDRPLEAQTDAFWWGQRGFERIDGPYFGSTLVVRGFDPAHRGIRTAGRTASLDAGCGFGGPLVAACVTAEGGIVDTLEA